MHATGALAGRAVPVGYAKFCITPRTNGGDKHSELVSLSDTKTVRHMLTTLFNISPDNTIPELPANPDSMFFEVDDALMQS